MFTHGIYKTMIGIKAIVAQTKQVGVQWVIRGAIFNDGIYIMCHWTSGGRHLGGDTRLDLMRSP